MPESEGAQREDLLILADSETDSDLFHATGFLVPDPLIYLELGGEKLLLVNDLEYGRALAQARVDRVVSITPLEEKLRSEGQPARLSRVLDLFLKEAGVQELTVPASFPLGQAESLRELGYRLKVRQDPFFRERPYKTPEEVDAVRKSQQAAEACMGFVVDHLRRSEIRGERLIGEGGEPLTSEWLRTEAHKFLLDRGYIATTTIIAGGDQGCDPHLPGSGPLPAHQTIIIDIFPRSMETRYWGDITRTVVRGRASEAVKKLYRDVEAAQEAALGLLRHGVQGGDVHQAVVDLLASRGNPTEQRNGKKVGFFHGTGHGVGLDLHELPRIGKVDYRLEAGSTVTVEPGLYYPGVGGVRLEDLVVITEDGHLNLTSFPKELEV